MGKKKTRAKYLDNRDLALKIMSPEFGFEHVRGEVGDRLTPVRASKIVELLKDDYGYKDKAIPRALRELAESKIAAHKGGHVKPPMPGEERDYMVSEDQRIGVKLNTLGLGKGEKARVRFGKDKIEIVRRP